MPDRAPHFCAVPGCSTLTIAPRCPAHFVDVEHQRTNYAQRTWYRTPQWKALRRQILRDQGYACALCHQVIARLDIDHIVKHAGDTAKFWDRANLHAICKPCHTRKTRAGA